MDEAALLRAPAAVVAGATVVPLFVHHHGLVTHSALTGHGSGPLVMAVLALPGLAGLAWAVADRHRGAPMDVRSLLAMQTLGHVTLTMWSVGLTTVAHQAPALLAGPRLGPIPWRRCGHEVPQLAEPPDD